MTEHERGASRNREEELQWRTEDGAVVGRAERDNVLYGRIGHINRGVHHGATTLFEIVAALEDGHYQVARMAVAEVRQTLDRIETLAEDVYEIRLAWEALDIANEKADDGETDDQP